MSTLTHHLNEVIAQINNKNAILFLGSGSTLFCKRLDGKRGATGDGLAKEILLEINNGVDPGFNVSLMEACEYYTSMKASGRKGLDAFVQSRLRDLRPTIGHYIACSFPWRAIITTNFNEVAENAWKTGNNEGFAANEIVTIKTQGDLDQYKNDDRSRVRFYKPHGCISVQLQQENRMVLTSKDYAISQRIRKEIYEEIKNLTKQYTTVFVGYSLADYTFRNIFYELNSEMLEWTQHGYSISPVAPELKFEWMSQSMKDNFNINLINLSFDVFMLHLIKQNQKIHPTLKNRIVNSWDEMSIDNSSWLNGLSLNDFQSLPNF